MSKNQDPEVLEVEVKLVGERSVRVEVQQLQLGTSKTERSKTRLANACTRPRLGVSRKECLEMCSGTWWRATCAGRLRSSMGPLPTWQAAQQNLTNWTVLLWWTLQTGPFVRVTTDPQQAICTANTASANCVGTGNFFSIPYTLFSMLTKHFKLTHKTKILAEKISRHPS